MSLALVFYDDEVERRLISRALSDLCELEFLHGDAHWRVMADPRPDVIVVCVDDAGELLRRARVWSGGVPVVWITDRIVEVEDVRTALLWRPPHSTLLRAAVVRAVDTGT